LSFCTWIILLKLISCRFIHVTVYKISSIHGWLTFHCVQQLPFLLYIDGL
jgi:hypothetical protein